MSSHSNICCTQEYLTKLRAIRQQNYQERKRIQQRLKLYEASEQSRPTAEGVAKQTVIVKKSKVGEIKSEEGLEKFDASSPSAIPPPISPPPKLDPEDRRRKIAALKVCVFALLYMCICTKNNAD